VLALIALLLAAMLPLSAWMLVRNPFNVAAIISFLTWTFGVGPGVYYLASGNIPSYSWRNFVFVGGPLSVTSDAEATLISLCLMSTLFTVGACAAWAFSPRPPKMVAAPRATSDMTTSAMVAIWTASALYFLYLARWNVWEFLLPVREAARASGYLETIFIMVPLAIVAKSYWARGRLDWTSLLWIAISFMAAFSRNQRRDFVTMALFIVGLLAMVHEIMPKPEKTSRPKGAARSGSGLVGIFSLIGAAALVPLLWYSRVYFTTQSRGEDIDPTQIRSFSDLLLGSPATGFPTLGLIRDFVSQSGTHILHIPTYLSAMIVPRAAWPHKPTDIDSKLQAAYHLIENPSSFWFGELYYCFGAFSTAAAAVFGFLAFRTAHEFNSSRSLLMRTIGVVIFMQSVTLYKNGLSQFALNSLTLISFLLLAWMLPADRVRTFVRPVRPKLQRVPLEPSILRD
jgi:hypothetical protein